MALGLTQELVQGLASYFRKCVRGYHLLNGEPIKESVWEAINTQVLQHAGCTVASQSNGSHAPGSDISSSVGNLSNKSVKYNESSRSYLCISSYRLSTVCSASNPGNITEILEEIKKRKNFDFYSIIAREEKPDNRIHYDWFLFPADHPVVDPSKYEWSPIVGQRGKNKGNQVGWKTNIVNGSSMSITFSMSSQLWMNICLDDGLKEKYIIANTELSTCTKTDYIDLADSYAEEDALESI
jgi:hypothetical protein